MNSPPISQRRLRDDIRSYYLTQNLSPEALDRLLAMTDAATPRRRSTTVRVALAAAVLTAVLVTGWQLRLPSSPAKPQATPAMVDEIADEIARNHRKLKAPKFVSSSWAELRSQMDGLDFALLEGRHPRLASLELVGARYCSLNGQVAAQLRLEDTDGEPVTLYQTPYLGELQEIQAETVGFDGLEIEMWSEHGVFFGLVRASSP